MVGVYPEIYIQQHLIAAAGVFILLFYNYNIPKHGTFL